MDAEERLELLSLSSAGALILHREDVEFARQGNLEGWVAGTYKRDGKTHKKGDPCIRKGDQVRPMPEGHEGEEGQPPRRKGEAGPSDEQKVAFPEPTSGQAAPSGLAPGLVRRMKALAAPGDPLVTPREQLDALTHASSLPLPQLQDLHRQIGAEGAPTNKRDALEAIRRKFETATRPPDMEPGPRLAHHARAGGAQEATGEGSAGVTILDLINGLHTPTGFGDTARRGHQAKMLAIARHFGLKEPPGSPEMVNALRSKLYEEADKGRADKLQRMSEEGSALENDILEHLKGKSQVSLRDIREATGHPPVGDHTHPVNQALVRLRDAGKVAVHEPGFGEPRFRLSPSTPPPEAPPPPVRTPDRPIHIGRAEDDEFKQRLTRKTDQQLADLHEFHEANAKGYEAKKPAPGSISAQHIETSRHIAKRIREEQARRKGS